MRVFGLAVVLCGLLALPAMAKTFELPDENPAVRAALPDGWKPREVEHGVEATSPDGETYVALETATARRMEALIDEDIAFLTDQGITIDKASQQSKDTTMNGMKVSFLHWTGKDKDGPTAVTLGIFGVSDNLVLLMTAWSSPKGDQLHGSELDGIVSSIVRK